MKDYLPKVRHKNKDIFHALYQQLCDNTSLILMFILMGTIHLLYQGYEFGVSNHTIQIPFLKSYFHPELYPNDPLIATRPHFTTFYFMFLAVIERLFGNLDLILFTAHLLTEILVFAAVYYLTYTIFKDRGVAAIALFLVFTALVAGISPFLTRLYTASLVTPINFANWGIVKYFLSTIITAYI